MNNIQGIPGRNINFILKLHLNVVDNRDTLFKIYLCSVIYSLFIFIYHNILNEQAYYS